MRTIPDLAAEMRALLSVVAEEDVGYALCGGLAGNTYGADQLTVDIDLVISPEDLGAALSLARTLTCTSPDTRRHRRTSSYGW